MILFIGQLLHELVHMAIMQHYIVVSSFSLQKKNIYIYIYSGIKLGNIIDDWKVHGLASTGASLLSSLLIFNYHYKRCECLNGHPGLFYFSFFLFQCERCR